jgi:hypothetical protein
MGWDAELVNKSYPWVEKQIVHRPTFSHWQRALRDGLLDAGVSPFNGFTFEHKYGTKLGGTIFDRFGRRHTAAELLASGNPNKLTVLIYATVQNIVFDTSGAHIYKIFYNAKINILSCELSRDILEFELSTEHNPIRHAPTCNTS